MGTNIDPCDLDPDVPMELWGPGYVGLSDASGPWVGGQEGETQARPLFCCLCCSARSFLPSGSTLGHVSSKRDLDEGGRRVRRETEGKKEGWLTVYCMPRFGPGVGQQGQE